MILIRRKRKEKEERKHKQRGKVGKRRRISGEGAKIMKRKNKKVEEERKNDNI